MNTLFPVSGVEAPLWLPPLVACVISFFTSMAGVSGAFLLLPFQMSVLGFTSPAVSSTNLVFNIVAIPSGVWAYVREERMLWPLTRAVTLGTVPGVFVGGWIRSRYLPDPGPFKAFAGCVLLYIGARLALDVARNRRRAPPAAGRLPVTVTTSSWRRLTYVFRDEEHGCSVPGVFALALIVGVVGGIYGIGGGAIIAPFLVTMFRLPIHTVAGATLMGTFVTSVAGVIFYQFVAPRVSASGVAVTPDWLLGALFGLGGLVGMYAGARMQRRLPARWLKAMLVLVLLWVGGRYLGAFLFPRAG